MEGKVTGYIKTKELEQMSVSKKTTMVDAFLKLFSFTHAHTHSLYSDNYLI